MNRRMRRERQPRGSRNPDRTDLERSWRRASRGRQTLREARVLAEIGALNAERRRSR